MKVRRTHPFDGSKKAGLPTGPILQVIQLDDHKPVDGPTRKNCIVRMKDGWEFIWNVAIIK
jgi:hypothetical protein